MKEIWKDIPGYEGRYQASNLGRIKSLPRATKSKAASGKKIVLNHKGKIFIKPKHTNNVGYYCGQLGAGIYIMHHRVVWMAFNGLIPVGLNINHINGIKTDNRVENLEAITPSENNIHARRNGRTKANTGKDILTPEEVKTIRFFDVYKKRGQRATLAKIFGKSIRTIARVCTRESYWDIE